MNDPAKTRRWTPLIRSGLLALGALSVAHAATTDINFDTDPTGTGLYTIASSEPTPWRATGGVGDSGYLAITDARSSQSSHILFKDFEPGFVMAAMKFSCDLRIGGGTDQPADGFSLNIVSADDPIVASLESGGGDGGNYAGTDGEASLPEEGSRTGLGIGYDTWQSATIGGIQDVVGISVRVNGELITQFPVPLQPGNVYPGGTYNEAPYRNLATDHADYLQSMQTGAQGGAGFGEQPAYGAANWGDWIQNLTWAKFEAEVTQTGNVILRWKGVELTPAGGLETQFTPIAGRILFGGRTGGAWEVHHVDNIHLETEAAQVMVVGGADGTPTGFRVTITDSGASQLDPGTLALSLDGSPVTATDVSKNGGLTTISFDDPASPFVSGSTHTLLVEASDGIGNAVSESREFTVPDFLTLDPGLAVAGATTPGFVLDVYHVDVGTANTVQRAERQLHGDIGPNRSLDQGTGGVMETYIETGVINYAQDDEIGGAIPIAAGNFTDANGNPDALIPGLNLWESGVFPYADNLALAINTVLHFSEQGTYELIFNSDDGFRTMAHNNSREQLNSVIVSVADVGKGASDVTRLVYIPQPGYYPMRTVWFEGGGGASLEWAVRTPSSGGQAMLINAPGSVMAYQVATGDIPSAVSFVDPVRDSGNPYPVTAPITVDIVNGSTPVDVGSVKLLVNGADTGASASATADGATISYTPAAPYPSGSTVEVGVEFTGYSGSYTFTVPSYTVLPGALATAIGTGADPGMTWRVVQTSTGQDNNIAPREAQLAGAYGASVHDPAGEVAGVFQIDFVNFEQGAGNAGQFNAGAAAPQDVADAYLPGIPSGHNTDQIAAECETYVQFDTAGFKTMVVNSDDGFHVTSGVKGDSLSQKKHVSLGLADYGKGSSDIVFNIWVEQPGVYYMRLMWWEGGGGANAEWFTVNPDGSRALVGGTQTGSLPAFRTRTVAEPALELVNDSGSIGLNFAADEAAGSNSGTLADTDVAGVVPQANWNNLRGGTNPWVNSIMDEDGNPTSVQVAWRSPNTWSTTGRGEENNCLSGPDATLMTGYLDTNNDSTTDVVISGIPSAQSYDLYLYASGGVVGRGGGYRVFDAITGNELRGWRQVQSPECPPCWVQAPEQPTPEDWTAGNYILFCDLGSTDIIIQASTKVDPITGLDLGYPSGTQRASLNGAQLVFPATCQPPDNCDGDQPVLTWTFDPPATLCLDWDNPAAILEEAPTVTGPWTPVADTSKPYCTSTTGAQMYYRAVLP